MWNLINPVTNRPQKSGHINRYFCFVCEYLCVILQETCSFILIYHWAADHGNTGAFRVAVYCKIWPFLLLPCIMFGAQV